MDTMTQQNAALVEQAAAAAESLQDQAQQLSAAVSAFRLEGRGAAQVVALSDQAAKPHQAAALRSKAVRAVPVRKPATPLKVAAGEWEEF
jgi:methyl-accepting chemotaxis protein